MKKYEKRTKIVKCKYKMCHAMSYGERAIETNGYDRKEMVNIYINIWFRFISTTIPNIAPVTYDFQIVQLCIYQMSHFFHAFKFGAHLFYWIGGTMNCINAPQPLIRHSK